MKIVEKSPSKAKKSGHDAALGLLCLCITPFDGKSKAPAGSTIRTTPSRRRARNAREADHFEHLTAKQEQQKTYYDERARATPLSPVVPRQPAVIRNKSTNRWDQPLRSLLTSIDLPLSRRHKLTKKSRPCRGTFARANQADRCVNLLHSARRSTP